MREKAASSMAVFLWILGGVAAIAGIVAPGIIMYTADGLVSYVAAVFFVLVTPPIVFSAVRGVVRDYVREYLRAEEKLNKALKGIQRDRSDRGKAAALRRVFDVAAAHNEFGSTELGVTFRALSVLVCGFIVLAMIFAAAYAATSSTTLGSSFWGSVYFSAVALSTVGFGDVQPVSVGKILVVVEIVYGFCFYAGAIATVATLMARMSFRTETTSSARQTEEPD